VERERGDRARVDRWLYAARIFKSRAQATAACNGGHVKCAGQSVKAHHPVAIGTRVEVQTARGVRVLEVRALAIRRLSPPLARELYEDHSPPPPAREERFRHPGVRAGRPGKRDRAELRRLRGR
jgi:ribosome-associated heat shock protein Hsp15